MAPQPSQKHRPRELGFVGSLLCSSSGSRGLWEGDMRMAVHTIHVLLNASGSRFYTFLLSFVSGNSIGLFFNQTLFNVEP